MGDLRRITERYRLDKLEGSSEGWTVFRGLDLESGETVAVELIEGTGPEGGSRERFLEIARALRSPAHPALPRALDSGFTNAGSAFLVTAYLHGAGLEDSAGSAPGHVLSLLLLLVDGLEAMAELGIAHGDLRPGTVLVTPGDEGEQVKIRGLGSAAFRARPLAEGYAGDLQAFGLLACQVLRVPVEAKLGIPLEVGVELEDIEALRALLDAATHGDPTARYRSWREVRNALRKALFGAGGRRAGMRSETIVHPPDDFEAGTRPDAPLPPDPAELQTQVFLPPDLAQEEDGAVEELIPTLVIPPQELPPPPAEPAAAAALSGRKRLPRVPAIAAAAAVLVVVVVAAVAIPLLIRSRPEPRPDLVLVSRPVPPPPVHASLAPAPSVPAPVLEETAPEITAPAPAPKELARARRVLAIESRLSRAQRAGNPLEVIRQAGALLQERPGAGHAAEQRERAAAAVEREADAELEEGRLDAALSRLEGLRQVWPDRSGLPARIDRIAAERKADQELESLLAAATRAGKAGKPLDGLQLLAGARPGRRWADRFQELLQALEAQAADLDRKPPELALRGPEPVYEKGKPGIVPLRVTDDAGVKTVEAWARPEGGAWRKVPVNHLSGSDYSLEVPPEVHQNRNVEFYAVATDASGHTGQLGSAESPRRMKRRNWIEKLLGREKGAGEGT